MHFSKWFYISEICVFVLLFNDSEGSYQIPKVILKAFKPKGFQAAIVADDETQLFSFHGAINRQLQLLESGEFNAEIKEAKNGYFMYSNPDLELKVGDIIFYWVYVQHSYLGYRIDDLQWNVTVLEESSKCSSSETKLSNSLMKICSEATVFEDTFDGDTLNENKWIIEQYIPGEPDFEFVIYKKDKNVTHLKDGYLYISPMLRSDESINEQSLDLSSGCTREKASDKCFLREKFIIQNPILSGRIVSKLKMFHCEVEIRAKLPVGDWIYPEIYLEDTSGKRIVIAYARGNRILKGNEEEIGGSLLFGGPMLSNKEPKRSSKLSSTRNSDGLFSDTFHVYKLRWSKDGINLYLDGENYGHISTESISSSGFNDNANQFQLVLGVGVGGSSDFPDGFTSGDTPKPWVGLKAKRVKNFYDDRRNWLPTWTDAKLAVDYVKITAI